MNAKVVFLACFAAAACITTQNAFAENAMKAWLEYREAHGLPVTAPPSDRAIPNDWILMELSLSDGNADRAALVRAIEGSRAKGNGNGNGHTGTNGGTTAPKSECPMSLLSDLARTDGNPQGEHWTCDRAP